MTDPFRVLDSGLRYYGQQDALAENRRQFDKEFALEQNRFDVFRKVSDAQIEGYGAQARRDVAAAGLADAQAAEVAPNAAANRELAAAETASLRGGERRAQGTYDRANDAQDVGAYLRTRDGGGTPEEIYAQGFAVLRNRGYEPEQLETMGLEAIDRAILNVSKVPVESGARVARGLIGVSDRTQNKDQGIANARADSYASQGLSDPNPRQNPNQFYEMAQAETDKVASKLQAYVDKNHNGNLASASRDPDFVAYLSRVVETHPELNRVLGGRTLVDGEDPSFSLRQLASAGAFGALVPVVKNSSGNAAPITAGGAPYDPEYVGDQGVLAFTPGELAQAIMTASTRNGGSISLFGPMMESAEAQTLAGVQQRSPEDYERLVQELMVLEEVGVSPEDRVGVAQGDAFSQAGRTAESGEIQEALASARNASQRSIQGDRAREATEKRVDNLIGRATTNAMNRLGRKAGETQGDFFDQEFETYRPTDNEVRDSGLSATQLFRRNMEADVRDTLANPQHLELLAARMGLPRDIGKWGVRDYNRAVDVILATRRGDVLNAWWQADTDTRGQITDEAIDAVLAGGNQGAIATRGPFE